MRSAVRFPLRLPVSVHASEFDYKAETKDISAGGVLLYVDELVAVGTTIDFTIQMPAGVIGTDKDVVVNCVGRVVRCSPESGRFAVAAVIDEYGFEH
jgi:PilZ domain